MRPLPSEEATPPVTKTCLVGCFSTGFNPIKTSGDPRADDTRTRRAAGLAGPTSSSSCGVGHRGVGLLQPGQHPGQLLHAAGVVERGEARGGHRPVAALADDDVVVGERGDLRQVGDHEDLGRPREHGEPPADLDRRLAADAGVDLVEDEGRHRAGAGQRRPRSRASRGRARRRRRPCRAGAGRRPVLAASSSSTSSMPLRRSASGHRRPRGRARRAPGRHGRAAACGIASSWSSAVTPAASRSAASRRRRREAGRPGRPASSAAARARRASSATRSSEPSSPASRVGRDPAPLERPRRGSRRTCG